MTVAELPSDHTRLLLQAAFERLSPERVFDCMTQPALLQRWWPPVTQVDPRVGGRYCLSWPAQGWDLRGEFTAYEPGRRLAYTWAWDHAPQLPTRLVEITLSPRGAGTELRLTHSAYGDSDPEQADRTSHLEGWQYFLGRVAALEG
jgi:uncharacterized protein YndB with AHSA1/START domain